MALCHFHVGHIGRAGGQSAIASAAYRAGEELYSEYYGETNDFTRKGGVTYTEIMLPPNAPPEYKDRQTLWNAVEEVEKHKKAQLAYSFDIALQNEFTPEENLELARAFVQECLVDKGMIADLAVHEPDKGNDGIPNPHFHVMTTMRPLNPDGSWGNKQRREYVLDENGNRKKDENGNYIFNAVHTTDWHTPETLIWWRERWCELNNEVFERKGLDIRLDPRSYEERGIDQVPTIHEGPQVRQMEARGIPTEKGDKNRWIKATNNLIEKLKSKIQSILEWIKEQKTKLLQSKEPVPITPIDRIRQYYKQETRKSGNSPDTDKLLKEMAGSIQLMEENGIQTMVDLDRFVGELDSQVSGILAECREIDSQIMDLDTKIQLGETVIENRPVIDQMNEIHFKTRREKYAQTHREKINQYYSAKRTLKEKYKVPKIAISSWKKEKQQLQTKKTGLEEQCKPIRKKVDRLMKIRYQAYTVEKAEERARNQQKILIRNKMRNQPER